MSFAPMALAAAASRGLRRSGTEAARTALSLQLQTEYEAWRDMSLAHPADTEADQTISRLRRSARLPVLSKAA